jgi:hypothetical protein
MLADRAQLLARGPHGFTILDLVFSCAALCVMCAVAIPQTLSTIERSRGFGKFRGTRGRTRCSINSFCPWTEPSSSTSS